MLRWSLLDLEPIVEFPRLVRRAGSQVAMYGLMRRLADRTGVYRWLRCSRYYETWSRIRGASFAKEVATDRAFFGQLFQERSIGRVFDVGANIGDKASLFAELGASVVCIEADPAMAELLEYRFSRQPRVSIEGVAVGAEPGIAKMFRKTFSGFNTLSEKWSQAVSELGVGGRDAIDVSVTTLDKLIDRHGAPDYIKIDVEGFELPTIRGLSCPMAVISFEVNVPSFLAETRLIMERLGEIQPGSVFNLRLPDESRFKLREAVPVEELLLALERLGHSTCDVFAFRSATSCAS